MTSDTVPVVPRGFSREQIDAGWRSMWLLARFVQRGGHPVAVAPTVSLRPAEEQYGAFPADVLSYTSDGVYVGGGLFWGGGLGIGETTDAATSTGTGTGTGEDSWQARGRHGVTVTSERLIFGDPAAEDREFRDLILIQPNPLDWSVNLYFQGSQPIMLRSPWVPWMTVVLCAELYGSPWPPGHIPGSDLPATAVC